MKILSTEITVALIGNVSAGKTTLLNALLKAKFGEVSMKRTTTGANYFRIHSKAPSDESAPGQWTIPPANPRSSDSILKEIVDDNQVKIRKGDIILEKTFDVELNEPLVDCRKNTTLVIVDIPGINEAHTDEGYKEYVSNKWNTFDCVIVVMDGKQGVNTQEQVFLLDFVKQNLIKKKKVSVIVLCNKIDDPKDEEQAELVREAQKEVEKMFKAILDTSQLAFIPISSIHAYIHQCASTLTMDQFKRFDNDLIERLGRDQVGRRRWNKMSTEEKLKEAYSLVSDPDSVEEALRDSNFDKFLSTLRKFVGGESKQLELLSKQLEVAREEMLAQPYKQGKIISIFRTLYERTRHLVIPERVEYCIKVLRTSFWTAYRNYEDYCLLQFKKSVRDVNVLAGPMEDLMQYFTFLVENGVFDEQLLTTAKGLVRKSIFILVSNRKIKYEDGKTIELFSQVDWCTIWSSILLLSYHKHFCLNFGKEKLIIERCLNEDTMKCLTLSDVGSTDKNCPKCKKNFSYSNTSGSICDPCKSYFPATFSFVCIRCKVGFDQVTKICKNCKYVLYLPTDVNHYIPLQRCLEPYMFPELSYLPDSIDDPKHYGHLLFKFCSLMDRYEELNMI